MTENSIQTRLNKLSQSKRPRFFRQREVEAVYWYCKLGPFPTELELREKVAAHMGVSDTTVFNHLRTITTKLEIDDLRYIPDEVCQTLVPIIDALPSEMRRIVLEKDEWGEAALTETILAPVFSELQWPHRPVEQTATESATDSTTISEEVVGFPPVHSGEESEDASDDPPDAISRALDEEERRRNSLESTGGSRIGEWPRQTGSTSNASQVSGNNGQVPSLPSWLLVLIPVILLLGLTAWGINRLRGPEEIEVPLLQQPTIDAVVSEQVAQTIDAMVPTIITQEVTIEVTVPPDPNQVAMAINSTVEARPTQTPRLATQEVQVTVVARETVRIDVPVTVEVTPLPTPTPTETPLPVNITISEDFDDVEINPALTMVGEPLFTNGRLASPGRTEILIGDETWRNYNVQYQINTLTVQPCAGVGELIVRNRHQRDRLSMSFDPCWVSAWIMTKNGDSVTIPDSRIRPFDSAGRINVTVEDGNLYHQSEGSVFELGNIPENGGIVIVLSNGWIDNLVVTRND